MTNKTLFKTVFGSHMYGLNTPTSDLDYKSVSLPSLKEILLSGPMTHSVTSTGDSNTKNGADDVDHEDMSLMKFLLLARKGEMIALDMLHSPRECYVSTSPVWELLVENRSFFYTKQMDAYLGYLRRQVAKYGLRGSRMHSLQEAFNVVSKLPAGTRLETYKSLLFVDGEYALFSTAKDRKGVEWEYYEVLGAKYQLQDRVENVQLALEKKLETYGERARMASRNEGIDWKAVHHALRSAMQLRDLYTTGKMRLPFTGGDRDMLMAVKRGEFEWGFCSEVLSAMSDKVVELARTSSYPESVDHDAVNALALECYRKEGYFK